MTSRAHLSLVPKVQSAAERWWYGHTNPALLDIGDAAAGLDGEYADEGATDWHDWPSFDTDDEHAYIARAAAALGRE